MRWSVLWLIDGEGDGMGVGGGDGGVRSEGEAGEDGVDGNGQG